MYSRYETTIRCCGKTRQGKRCIKNASYEHSGNGYCNTHYQRVLCDKKKEQKK